MAPNTTRQRHSNISDEPPVNGAVASAKEIDIYSPEAPPIELVWRNAFLFIYLHAISLYGLYLCLTNQVMWQTYAFSWGLIFWGGFGITAGAHRLWTHKCYKAKLPLRLFLLLGNTVAFQNSVWEWSRDHRVHHKFAETHADPHNIKRGFFFAHMGWLLTKKHQAVKEKGKTIDMSDLEADPWLMFQRDYYVPLVLSISFFIPALICYYGWGESAAAAWCVCAQLRFTISLHGTWLVNSAAHVSGNKPYDKNIYASENKLVAAIALGEGWHNYHHVFPWDYKTSELGFYNYNFSTAFIDFMAKLGQAYDLKSVPAHIVKQRVARSGDGTHLHSHGHEGLDKIVPGPYGWGDADIPEEDIAVTETLYPK